MSMHVSKFVNRRTLMAACLITPAAALTMGPASAAPSAQNLPEGQSVGAAVSTADDGSQIFEVLDSRGQRVGFTLEATKLDELNAASTGLETEADEAEGMQAEPASVTGVAACVAAIAWFAAQTVFPTVRVANLAIRLGGLISKYGARTVARIFMGARNIGGRTAQQEVKEFALAASGVGGLMACGI